MNTEKKPQKSSKLEYIVGNSGSIFDKGSVNPSFKVMEDIYSNGKISFFDKINGVSEYRANELKDRPSSLTPVPVRQYRGMSKSSVKKEDIFLNPAAFYLSRKPIAFSKHSREAMRQKTMCDPLPVAKPAHRKANSLQVPSNNALLFKDTLINPIEEKKNSSVGLVVDKYDPCGALTQLANYCEDSLKVKTPLIGKQQKVAERYSKEMEWITETLQSYGNYKPKIMKELFRYTVDSRDDLEVEREKIVHQIKTGAFDPNKNVIRLRARLKKRKDKGF